MLKLRISPEAEGDLIEIKEYISVELGNPIAAINTVRKITQAVRRLAGFPYMGALLSSVVDVQSDYRFLVCGNYLAFYRCDSEAVYVVRVLYGRRDYLKILFDDFTNENESPS